MKSVKWTFISNYIFRTVLVIGAVILAINGIKGWGWLILVAAITGLTAEN